MQIGYEVIVGNVGKVCQTMDKTEAEDKFGYYVTASVNNEGRAGGENVTLMHDGEIIREHDGDNGE